MQEKTFNITYQYNLSNNLYTKWLTNNAGEDPSKFQRWPSRDLKSWWNVWVVFRSKFRGKGPYDAPVNNVTGIDCSKTMQIYIKIVHVPGCQTTHLYHMVYNAATALWPYSVPSHWMLSVWSQNQWITSC